MKLNQYLAQTSSAAKSEDGEKLSKLLSFGDFHAQSIADEIGNVGFEGRPSADAFIQPVSHMQVADVERLCQKQMPPMWDEVVAVPLRVIQLVMSRRDLVGAAEQQNLLVQWVLGAFSSIEAFGSHATLPHLCD